MPVEHIFMLQHAFKKTYFSDEFSPPCFLTHRQTHVILLMSFTACRYFSLSAGVVDALKAKIINFSF